MAGYVAAVILVAYASLLFELTVIHVPSVASSLSIWAPSRELLAACSPRYRRILELGRPVKLLAFFLPLAVVYAVYTYPIVILMTRADLLGDYLFVPGRPSELTAVTLIVAGRALALAAALTVRRRNAQAAGSFTLHTSGPFRWSRNPGLVGMYLFVSGLWLAAPSASMLAGILLYVAYMDIKVRMEEDFLRSKFGEPYRQYRLKTGRYIR